MWAASLQQEGAICRKEVPKCTQKVPKCTLKVPKCTQEVPKCTIFIFATSNTHQLLSVIDEYLCHKKLEPDSHLGEYYSFLDWLKSAHTEKVQGGPSLSSMKKAPQEAPRKDTRKPKSLEFPKVGSPHYS